MNSLLVVLQGQQKAVVGGLAAGALALLSSVGISGDLTVKEALYALATWVVTHATVYLTRNK